MSSYQNASAHPETVDVPANLISQNLISSLSEDLNTCGSGSHSSHNSPLQLNPHYHLSRDGSQPSPTYGAGNENIGLYKASNSGQPPIGAGTNRSPYPSGPVPAGLGAPYGGPYYGNENTTSRPLHPESGSQESLASQAKSHYQIPLHYQNQHRVFVPPQQRSRSPQNYFNHQNHPHSNQHLKMSHQQKQQNQQHYPRVPQVPRAPLTQQPYSQQYPLQDSNWPITISPEGSNTQSDNHTQVHYTGDLVPGEPHYPGISGQDSWQYQMDPTSSHSNTHPYAQRHAPFSHPMKLEYSQMPRHHLPNSYAARPVQPPPNGKEYDRGNRDQGMHQQNYTNHRPNHSSHIIQLYPQHSSTNTPRRVVTDSGTAPSSNQRRETNLKTRTKSMASSAQSMATQTQLNSTQRTPSTGSSHSFSFTSKSRSLNSLGMLSSLSKKGNGSSNNRDRVVSQTSVVSKNVVQQSRKPSVYPAILSRVARTIKENILLDINMKDGLEYHDSFTGKAAIDVICDVIRTNDRNLALLMGRALDAQKFFHDVTYNHRLRDSNSDVYAFTRVFSDVEFYADENINGGPSGHASINRESAIQLPNINSAPYPTSPFSGNPGSPGEDHNDSFTNLNKIGQEQVFPEQTGVNGVFTILTECYSPTCTRNRLCYSIACPRRLEQQARLNLKPRGGLRKAVSRLSLHDTEASKTLWHETVDHSILDKLDKHEKMRQELIYELIYTERDYVKDLEFMTDFYIMPLRNPINNIIPERERDAFIRTVFGGVSELLRLAKSLSEALTARQQAQKPVVTGIGDVILLFIGNFDPFIKYSGNKVFASFEHERQQQVNIKYARFLEAIEKKPESRRQDFSSFLIKGVQRPARYQLLLSGILKNTKEDSPDYASLVKAKEEIEEVLVRINLQTGEATDRHKIMVLHRLLGRQTLEDRYNFKLNYNNRIIYQVTLSRKRDNEKIDLYLFEHALLLIKHKIQNKREVHKVFGSPIYLPLLFVNSGYDTPTFKLILAFREDLSLLSDSGLKAKLELTLYNQVSTSQQKLQLNFVGLGTNPVHVSLLADDLTHQNQILLQILLQQRRLIEKYDIFSIAKYETRRFTGNNRINCSVPCYGGKKLLYGTDSGVWVSTVRSISMTSTEKICSDPTMVISKPYVTQMEVLVEYSKILVLSDKILYEFDLSSTDSLDHAKNTRSGKIILSHVTSFKTGVCDGKLLVCAMKSGSKSISIVEPTNPFDNKNRNRIKRPEVREISFSSDPVSISFLKTKLCIGCTKGFEILSLEAGRKEPILDRADPSLDFATQRETVSPLSIHRLDKNFLLSYSEFSFLINRNGWRTNHDWGIFWEGTPQNIALFYPYLLAFDPGFIEIRDLESTNLIRALVGENIRFLHSNEHEALYACEENGYDIIVSIDFLNLKPKAKNEAATK